MASNTGDDVCDLEEGFPVAVSEPFDRPVEEIFCCSRFFPEDANVPPEPPKESL